MNRTVLRKLIVPYLLLSGAVFVLLSMWLTPAALLMVTNSLFIGTMVSITVSYGGILLPTILNRKPYDDVSQMAIGILMSWASIGMLIAGSIYILAIDAPITVLLWGAVARWIAINGAIIQITAPDFGHDFLYGRDRKLLWAGFVAGAIVAVLLYLMQDGSLI